MHGLDRNHGGAARGSHRTLEAIPALPGSVSAADVFEMNDALYVEMEAPASARVLHIDVRLGAPPANRVPARPIRSGAPTRSRSKGTGEGTFSVHPDATPC
jgi:hypothetical protein